MTEQVLAGKTAFVSGSGRNIGRAIAVQLAKMGCNVAINGASNRGACEEAARLVEAEGVKSAVVIGDMGKRSDLDRIADEALQHFGRIDILVNNAAIRPHKPFLDLSDDDWNSVVDTGLTSAFLMSRAFLPGMVEGGWGRIISMAGMKAIKGYFEGAPISASKHGIVGLTRALSQEFGPKGITANAVSPGQTRVDGKDGKDPKRIGTIPVGSLGEPKEIAAVVAFLASPAARFVNGQMIGVNGGEAT